MAIRQGVAAAVAMAMTVFSLAAVGQAGEETRFKRETSSALYVVLEGEGATEIGDQRFDWATNDIFVVPNFLWRRHINSGAGDAILYAVSEQPLLEKIAQYRAQGRLADGTVTELA